MTSKCNAWFANGFESLMLAYTYLAPNLPHIFFHYLFNFLKYCFISYVLTYDVLKPLMMHNNA